MTFEIEYVNKDGTRLYGPGDRVVVNWSGPGWYAPASEYSASGWATVYYYQGNDPNDQPETYTRGVGTPGWYDGYKVVTPTAA